MSELAKLREFLADPENFLYGLDWRTGACTFAPASRKILSDMPFLDNRTLGQNADLVQFSAKDVTAVLKAETYSPVNFLFHSAFCCSTLVARCLDLPGRNLSLKEPFALLGLSGYVRSNEDLKGEDLKGADMWLHLFLHLLGRRFAKDEKILIKPSNGANNTLLPILGHGGVGKVVLLYSDLDSFLASAIGGGSKHASYISQMAGLFQKDFGEKKINLEPLTPIHKATFVWGLQLRHFENVTGSNPNVKTLDCNMFLQNPETSLGKLNEFYGLDFSRGELAGILAGPAFRNHAKEQDKPYSPEERAKDRNTVLAKHEEDIKKAHEWAKENGFDFSDRLSNPL